MITYIVPRALRESLPECFARSVRPVTEPFGLRAPSALSIAA